jgi:hypothetical protein
VEDAILLTDSDGSGDKGSSSCGRGEAFDADTCSGKAVRLSEGEEQVKVIDDDENGDGNLDPGECELSGRLLVPAKIGNTKLNAQFDTASRSVWASNAWYSRHFGEPDLDSTGAFGADSSALDLTGEIKVTLFYWGVASFMALRCNFYVG